MADRVFRIYDKAGLRAAFIAAWGIAGQLIGSARNGLEVVVRPMKDKRSVAQNRRYWMLLRELSEVAWVDGQQFSAKTWHEHFKRELIGCEEFRLPSGVTELRGISTTTLSVEQFGDYMTQIEAWAASQGWPLMTAET